MWGWAAGRGGLQLQPEEPGDADRSGTTWIAGHTANHAVQPALSDMRCPSFGSSPHPRGSPCTPPKGVSQPVSLPGPLCTSVSSAGQTAASRPPPPISFFISIIFYSQPNHPVFWISISTRIIFIMRMQVHTCVQCTAVQVRDGSSAAYGANEIPSLIIFLQFII